MIASKVRKKIWHSTFDHLQGSEKLSFIMSRIQLDLQSIFTMSQTRFVSMGKPMSRFVS